MFRFLACTLTLALWTLAVSADDDCGCAAKCEVKPDAARLRMFAALQLQACARSREAKAKPSYDCCHDLAEARKVAAAKGLPVLVWVGGCDPASRNDLDAAGVKAVHCHAPAWGPTNDKTPRLVIPVSADAWREIPHKEITPEAVRMRLQ